MAASRGGPRGGGRNRNWRNKREHDPYMRENYDAGARGEKVKVDYDSPVIQEFLKYRKVLDAQHDKYERIVKLSRDITIESKRIIFLLHRSLSENESSVLSEAEDKFKHIEATLFKDLAIELRNNDPYQYLKAYYAGLQEYVEALTFYDFIKHNALSTTWQQLQQRLTYKVDDSMTKTDDGRKKIDGGGDTTGRTVVSDSESVKSDAPQVKSDETTVSSDAAPVSSDAAPVSSDAAPVSSDAAPVSSDATPVTCSVTVPAHEFMLGVLDMSGELMRMCVSAVGSGDRQLPFTLCQIVRQLQAAFGRVDSSPSQSWRPRQKIQTLRQSLQKMERVCYTIQVRGEEVPAHRLVDVFGGHEDGGGADVFE